MPINVAHEPNQQVFGLLQMLAGFGEAKRRYENQKNQQQAASSQQTANAIGGAIGDVGTGYFKGKTARYQLDEQKAQQQQQNAFRLQLEQQDQDLRSFGLPTTEIERMGSEQGMDASAIRQQLRWQKVQEDQQAKHFDDTYEYKLSPKQEREYREITDGFNQAMDPHLPYTEEERGSLYQNLMERAQRIRPMAVPRTTPKPTNFSEMLASGDAYTEEVPGGRVYATKDRSGAYRFEHIKYQQEKQEPIPHAKPPTIDEINSLRADLVDRLTTYKDVPGPKDKDGKLTTKKVVDHVPDERELQAGMNQIFAEQARIVNTYYGKSSGQIHDTPTETSFGPGAMPQGEAPPLPQPGEVGPPASPVQQAQQALGSLVSEFGNPKQWPKEIKAKALPMAQSLVDAIDQEFPRGGGKVPGELLPYLLMAKEVGAQ